MIKLINEKGNVSAKVRADLKSQIATMLKNRVGNELVDSPKGLTMEIGHDEAGHSIYAVIDITITQDLEPKKKAPSKAKAKDEVVTPNIFDAE